jgi:FkbM family methyltransferase
MGLSVRSLPSQPLWVRIVRPIVSRIPRGKYAIVSRWTPRRGCFVAALADDVGGARFDCDLADAIDREVCLTGYYEPPVTRIVQRLAARAGTVVDAGANWGYFSLLAAAAVGERGRVIALEPDPRHFERLTRNIAMNRFTQITPLQVAAGARDGIVTLAGYAHDAENRGVSRIAASPRGAQAFDVRCTTIDAATGFRDRVDAVKIDVEGAEMDVLRGMCDGLAAARYASIVLELHPALLRENGVDPAACIQTLLAHGYRGWSIDLSRRAYRSAAVRGTPIEGLLRPTDEWRESTWPHLLWLAPGEALMAC